MQPRNTRVRRSVLIVIAVLAAFSTLVSVFGVRELRHLRATVQQHVDQLVATLDAQDRTRPVLRGAARAENAWLHYAAALDAHRQGEPLSRSVTALRLGVACAIADCGTRWQQGFDAAAVDVLAFTELADLARNDIVHRLEDGASPDELDELMDLAMFGRDVSATGTLVAQLAGKTVIDRSLDVLLRDSTLSAQLAATQMRIAAELATLERCLPAARLPYDSEACGCSLALLNGETVWFSKPDGVLGKLHALGMRVLAPDAAQRVQTGMAHVAAATELPWPEARRAVDRVNAEFDAALNPVMASAMRPSLHLLLEWRLLLARLRMLRAGLHGVITGEALALDDPFGERLQIEIDERRVRVSSVGPDGKLGGLSLEIARR